MTREELIQITGSEEAANDAIDAVLACVKPAFVQSAMKLYGKRKGKRFNPELNEKYRDKKGGMLYKCVGYDGNDPILMNMVSCWTFVARDLVRYDDNTIDWGSSIGGFFKERW